MKKIIFGSDHGGFPLKNELLLYLKGKGYETEDVGTYSEKSVDYPDIAKLLSKKVLEDQTLGVLLCGTGIGISIAANKIHGIRAALVHNEYEAEKAREHNNANVICFGGRTIGPEVAKACLDKFLEGNFAGGRHEIRVEKIEK